MARVFMSGRERKELGATCTWENERGQVFVTVTRGSITENLPVTIANVLSLDPTFRLVSYSTVDAIITDLLQHRRDTWSPALNRAPRFLPERWILSMIGRRDVLHPRLGGPSW